MAGWNVPQGPFDIPDIPSWVPRRVKPWLFILFVIIIQFSGGVYLAAASDMVGSTALMQEDILMAGYASLVGMAINFCVMFRLKFRFSNRVGFLVCGSALIVANVVCLMTDSVAVLVTVCFIAGWFRMWATLVCNSTIQLWLTPVRDMSIFFCYVYLLVDGVIQLCGIATVYASFHLYWHSMHWVMTGLLALMMLLVAILVKPVKGPMQIPLLGIDWIGGALWSVVMLCFTFVCVYGDHYDWWEASEIRGATIIGVACVAINLWRATFLHHPYLSLEIFRYGNLLRATVVYLVFYTLMAPEHVLEHGYASAVLGFDATNLIDLNWYVLAGILCGCWFTYVTFARRKWRYKTMTVIAFVLATAYLAYFYFLIDYGMEKEALFVPLFCRGVASVIISIVFLTSVQGGINFFKLPQALTVNGFTGAVMGATLGPALIGELLSHLMAKNASLLGATLTASNPHIGGMQLGSLYGLVQTQALIVSMKEIYGWLLMVSITVTVAIALSYGPLRPYVTFPKWKTVRKRLRHLVRGY